MSDRVEQAVRAALDEVESRIREQAAAVEVGSMAWRAHMADVMHVGEVRRARAGSASTGESPRSVEAAEAAREVVGRWLADSLIVTGDSGDQVTVADVMSSFTMWLAMVGEARPAVSKTVMRGLLVDSMIQAGARPDRYRKTLVGVRL